MLRPLLRQASGACMAYLYPIILLSFSILFMTFAWYGHLKF